MFVLIQQPFIEFSPFTPAWPTFNASHNCATNQSSRRKPSIHPSLYWVIYTSEQCMAPQKASPLSGTHVWRPLTYVCLSPKPTSSKLDLIDDQIANSRGPVRRSWSLRRIDLILSKSYTFGRWPVCLGRHRTTRLG